MSVAAIAVGYHNTLPLRVGLQRLVESGDLHLDLARPAEATRRFAEGEFELGLLPTAARLALPAAVFVGEYGIVSDGFVGSVGIFSEVPLEEVEQLYLDHDSRSSVLLAQVLLRHYWQLSPKLIPARPGYRDSIAGTTAGVIIGDPAIAARAGAKHYYDLGAAWKAMTGLPFVYASWLAASQLPDSFLQKFERAQAAGLAQRHVLAAQVQPQVPNYNLTEYLTRQIHYHIDERAQAGRKLFLELGAELSTRPTQSKSRKAVTRLNYSPQLNTPG